MDGTNRVSQLQKRFQEIFTDKKSKLLFFFGIGGMALILLSAMPMREKPNPPLGVGQTQSAEEYVTTIERRLTALVGKIEGVGRCEVMVTAENDVEYVYAVEQTINTQKQNSFDGEQISRESQQQNSEQKYIVIDAGGGKKEALLKTRKQPTIQGVVVVCEGAKSKVVQQQVTQAVTTALGIPYHKVCITKFG